MAAGTQVRGGKQKCFGVLDHAIESLETNVHAIEFVTVNVHAIEFVPMNVHAIEFVTPSVQRLHPTFRAIFLLARNNPYKSVSDRNVSNHKTHSVRSCKYVSRFTAVA